MVELGFHSVSRRVLSCGLTIGEEWMPRQVLCRKWSVFPIHHQNLRQKVHHVLRNALHKVHSNEHLPAPMKRQVAVVVIIRAARIGSTGSATVIESASTNQIWNIRITRPERHCVHIEKPGIVRVTIAAGHTRDTAAITCPTKPTRCTASSKEYE